VRQLPHCLNGLVDLSKAFDCQPQDRLILKLEAYGLSKSALNLTHIYLSERKQCVKVGLDFSTKYCESRLYMALSKNFDTTGSILTGL
jgi:hypothetical protein